MRMHHGRVSVRVLPCIAFGRRRGGERVSKGQQRDRGILCWGKDGSDCEGSWVEESLHLVLVHVDVIGREDGAEGYDTWQ